MTPLSSSDYKIDHGMQFTHPEIQNALLHIMGKMVREKICTEVKDAGVYSILADKTKVSSKTEKMAIDVR